VKTKCRRNAEMEDTQNLFKMCLEEVDRMVSTKHVVGEPIMVEGNTVIPLISVGFGFGAGGGSGAGAKGEGSGGGAGTGAGGGVRPVGVIIVNKDGVKIETLHGAFASVAEKVADVAAKVVEKRGAKKEE
jgi:uncharacterized spore protein YtfJ